MSFGSASKISDKLLPGIVQFLFVKAAVSESTTVFMHMQLTEDSAVSQVAAGRPIPVLPHHTFPGDVIRIGDLGSGPATITSQVCTTRV